MIYKPLIFVHVPKAAGSSITNYFNAKQEHYPAKYYKKNYPDKFENFLVFACTRNPWARMVSAYFYQAEHGNSFLNKDYFLDKNPNFKIYLENELKKHEKNNSLIKPVMDWITEEDKVIVDYIINMHTIKKDFQLIRSLSRKKNNLEHLNKSQHGDYREYYKKDYLIQIVAEIFKKDIDYFKFDFEDRNKSDFERIINKEKIKKLISI